MDTNVNVVPARTRPVIWSNDVEIESDSVRTRVRGREAQYKVYCTCSYQVHTLSR